MPIGVRPSGEWRYSARHRILGHERPEWYYPTGRCAYLPSVTCYRQSIKPPPLPLPLSRQRVVPKTHSCCSLLVSKRGRRGRVVGRQRARGTLLLLLLSPCLCPFESTSVQRLGRKVQAPRPSALPSLSLPHHCPLRLFIPSTGNLLSQAPSAAHKPLRRRAWRRARCPPKAPAPAARGLIRATGHAHTAVFGQGRAVPKDLRAARHTCCLLLPGLSGPAVGCLCAAFPPAGAVMRGHAARGCARSAGRGWEDPRASAGSGCARVRSRSAPRVIHRPAERLDLRFELALLEQELLMDLSLQLVPEPVQLSQLPRGLRVLLALGTLGRSQLLHGPAGGGSAAAEQQSQHPFRSVCAAVAAATEFGCEITPDRVFSHTPFPFTNPIFTTVSTQCHCATHRPLPADPL